MCWLFTLLTLCLLTSCMLNFTLMTSGMLTFCLVNFMSTWLLSFDFLWCLLFVYWLIVPRLSICLLSEFWLINWELLNRCAVASTALMHTQACFYWPSRQLPAHLPPAVSASVPQAGIAASAVHGQDSEGDYPGNYTPCCIFPTQQNCAAPNQLCCPKIFIWQKILNLTPNNEKPAQTSMLPFDCLNKFWSNSAIL